MTLHQTPTAVIPPAGLALVAAAVAPVEARRARTRLQRWARSVSWQQLQDRGEAVTAAR